MTYSGQIWITQRNEIVDSRNILEVLTSAELTSIATRLMPLLWELGCRSQALVQEEIRNTRNRAIEKIAESSESDTSEVP